MKSRASVTSTQLSTPFEIPIENLQRLRARLYHVEPNSDLQKDSAKALAVVSHPYGTLGGSQMDPVVVSIAQTLQGLGVLTITFDFSSPSSWTGSKEREEYLAIVENLLKMYPQVDTLYCCGYSYGTLCLPTSEALQIRTARTLAVQYIVVSPLSPTISFFLTLSRQDRYSHMRQHQCLAIWGKDDQFSSSNKLKKTWVNGIEVETDHFWRNADATKVLEASIKAFLDECSI